MVWILEDQWKLLNHIQQLIKRTPVEKACRASRWWWAGLFRTGRCSWRRGRWSSPRPSLMGRCGGAGGGSGGEVEALQQYCNPESLRSEEPETTSPTWRYTWKLYWYTTEQRRLSGIYRKHDITSWEPMRSTLNSQRGFILETLLS